MLNLASPFDEELEKLVHTTIGCCITVHRELGPGLLESVYKSAMCVELRVQRLAFECEKSVPITYKGQLLTTHRLDLVVAGKVLVETKAVDRLATVHRAQVMSYLRVSGLRIGLLVNFNVPILPDGLRRIVL